MHAESTNSKDFTGLAKNHSLVFWQLSPSSTLRTKLSLFVAYPEG